MGGHLTPPLTSPLPLLLDNPASSLQPRVAGLTPGPPQPRPHQAVQQSPALVGGAVPPPTTTVAPPNASGCAPAGRPKHSDEVATAAGLDAAVSPLYAPEGPSGTGAKAEAGVATSDSAAPALRSASATGLPGKGLTDTPFAAGAVQWNGGTLGEPPGILGGPIKARACSQLPGQLLPPPSAGTVADQALRVASLAAVAPPSEQEVADSLQLLQTLLAKIARLDTEGFFQAPVTEAQAPGYSKIITRPMSFDVMRQKLADRYYRTWRSFVEDFELICANAMTYNQKRSRIHRAALTMLRQGKKVVVEAELVGRRAIGLVHPRGPAAAAAEEAAEAAARSAAGLPNSGSLPEASSELGGIGGTPLASSRRPASAVLEFDADDVAFGYGSSDDAPGYSSFSDTDLSDEEPSSAAISAGAGGGRVLIAPPTGGGRPFRAPAAANSGATRAKRSPAWKAETRSLERRCRWLELRLRELSGRTEAAQAKADALAASDSPAAAARLRHRSHRAAAPELAPAAVVLPFVAAHLRLGKRKRGAASASAEANAPAAASEKAAMGQANEEACMPARVYAALQLVERQVASVRRHLQATPQTNVLTAAPGGPPGRGGTRQGGGRGGRGPGSRAPGGRSGGGGGRASAAPARGSGGMERSRSLAPLRSDSMSGKRRRQEYDLADMVAPVKILAPKVLEKVAPIATPGWRLLSEEELQQRAEAVAYWAQMLKQSGGTEGGAAEGGAAAGDAAVRAAAGGGGEESSDEDTSDEAYLARHAPAEKEERAAYAAWAGAALQKKNKPNNSKKPRSAGKAGKADGSDSAAAPSSAAGGADTGGGSSEQQQQQQQGGATQPAAPADSTAHGGEVVSGGARLPNGRSTQRAGARGSGRGGRARNNARETRLVRSGSSRSGAGKSRSGSRRPLGTPRSRSGVRVRKEPTAPANAAAGGVGTVNGQTSPVSRQQP